MDTMAIRHLQKIIKINRKWCSIAIMEHRIRLISVERSTERFFWFQERSFSPGTFLNGTQKQLYYRNWTLFNCHNEKKNKSLLWKVFFGPHDLAHNDLKNLYFSWKAFNEIRKNMPLKVDRNEHHLKSYAALRCPIAIADLMLIWMWWFLGGAYK